MKGAPRPSASSIGRNHAGGGRNSAALARALDAERIARRRRFDVMDFDARHLGRDRQQIVGISRRERLALFVVDHALEKRVADAVNDAADESGRRRSAD